jgi:ATP phosphoribosyltransferase regulatory subunit HisZ
VRISAALPHGVTAFLFEAAQRRRELETRMVETLEDAGFSEVILPIVDYLEPYEPLLNPAARGELYRFIDRDGELLALRSDFTPMLARLLAPRLHTLELPVQVFYRGVVVRYEEERAGQQRELFQLGAELLGRAGEEAEREMLRLFLRLLASASDGPEGDGVGVVLGFAGALDRLLLAAEPPRTPLDLAEAVRRRERATVRRIPGAGPVLLSIVEEGVPRAPEDLGPGAAERLERLFELRDEVAAELPGARLSIDLAEFARHPLDPRVVDRSRPGQADGPDRGYYDGLVFRGYVGTGGQPVGAGGRYDRLFSHLGAEVPAVGFTVGLDQLLEWAVDEESPRRDPRGIESSREGRRRREIR